MNSIGKVFASGSVGFQTLPTKILAYESLYPSRAFACLSQSYVKVKMISFIGLSVSILTSLNSFFFVLIQIVVLSFPSTYLQIVDML